jgi:hypothetical protein
MAAIIRRKVIVTATTPCELVGGAIVTGSVLSITVLSKTPLSL